MGDRWGVDGPPEEAYSRVTRDLAEVTAKFADYLDDLPRRLVATYDCKVRELTDSELARLRQALSMADVDEAYAVQPADPECAALLVARARWEGAATAAVGFGVAQDWATRCWCDACDEDSASLIEQVEDQVRPAIEGCHEYCRPYVLEPHEHVEVDEPWMAVGFEWAGGGGSRSGPSVEKAFSCDWAPWPRLEETSELTGEGRTS